MNNKNQLGFFIGLFISCFLHASVILAYIYYDKNAQILKNAQKTPLLLSLSKYESKKENAKETKTQQQFLTRYEQSKKTANDLKTSKNNNIADTSVLKTTLQANIDSAQSSIASYNTDENESCKQLIKSIIEKHAKPYPKIAIDMRISGFVQVKIKVNANGDLLLAEIVDSSGYNILDSHTLKSVKKASKEFPKLPRDTTFTFPITYNLIEI